MKVVHLVTLCVLVGGCSREQETDTIQWLCKTKCEHDKRCDPDVESKDPFGDADAGSEAIPDGGSWIDKCVAACKPDKAPGRVFKPQVLSSWASCVSKLSCDGDLDGCPVQAVTATNPKWKDDSAYQACTSRRQECADSGETDFSEDDCLAYAMYTSDTLVALDDCMAQGCDTIHSCFDFVIGKK